VQPYITADLVCKQVETEETEKNLHRTLLSVLRGVSQKISKLNNIGFRYLEDGWNHVVI
jgi:hypothetical protein